MIKFQNISGLLKPANLNRIGPSPNLGSRGADPAQVPTILTALGTRKPFRWDGIWGFLNSSDLPANDTCLIKRSPSGLVVYPEEGCDLIQFARSALRDRSNIPNKRIVINTQKWSSQVAFDDPLNENLKNLAEKSGVTICLKISIESYAIEFEPNCEVLRQREQKKLAATADEGRRPISEEDRRRVRDIFQKFPEVKKAMKKTTWTEEEKRDLLDLVVEKTEGISFRYKQAMEELSRAIEGMLESGLNSEQQYQLLRLLAEKVAGGWVENAYKSLPTVIHAVKRKPWSFEQICRLLVRLAEKYGTGTDEAHEAIPKIIEEMVKAGWTDEEQYQFLILFAEKGGPWAYRCVHSAIRGVERSGWSYEQKCRLLILITEKSGENMIWAVYEALPQIIEDFQKKGWNKEQIYQFLILFSEKWNGNEEEFNYTFPCTLKWSAWMSGMRWSPQKQCELLMFLAEKASQEVERASNFAHIVFANVPSVQFERTRRLIGSLLDRLTDYNRKRVLDLLNSYGSLFNTIGPEHFSQHLELYATIFERWPRLGFSVLEGLLEATEQGLIPYDLSVITRRIFHFIEQTNGFIPTFYEAYLKKGDALFSILKVQVRAILKDEFGLQDARKVIEDQSKDYLLGLIQMASPTSGASFVEKEEQLGLMMKMIEAGDLRNDIPEKWRNRLETFEMSQGAYWLKEGQSADPEGKIKILLDQFRMREGEAKTDEKDLVAALEDYLKANRGPAARTKVQAVLYRLAGQNDALREKIDRIQDNDYTALTLLEQLFADKDTLQQTLLEAINQVDPQHLAGKGEKKKLGFNPEGFMKSLKAQWNRKEKGQLLPEKTRLLAMAKMLSLYEDADIEAKILNRPEVEGEFRKAIETVLHEAPALGKKELIAELLSEPLGLIRGEKVKYEYREVGKIKVGLRAVKGPAYGLSGLSSGVCTATDIELWKDPHFKLLAITTSDLIEAGVELSDEELMKQAVGYVHVYETEIDGKKYITLPGINPSAEFFGTVDAQRLYEEIMKKVILFAEAGDYHGIYIPTEPNIHSNRHAFQKAIQQAHYPVKKIQKVTWNRLPEPYLFEEVFVVWENS